PTRTPAASSTTARASTSTSAARRTAVTWSHANGSLRNPVPTGRVRTPAPGLERTGGRGLGRTPRRSEPAGPGLRARRVRRRPRRRAGTPRPLRGDRPPARGEPPAQRAPPVGSRARAGLTPSHTAPEPIG